MGAALKRKVVVSPGQSGRRRQLKHTEEMKFSVYVTDTSLTFRCAAVASRFACDEVGVAPARPFSFSDFWPESRSALWMKPAGGLSSALSDATEDVRQQIVTLS